jgi:hypothetical protein
LNSVPTKAKTERMKNLLIFYEIYQGTSSIKSSITFFIVQSGYHYYFEDIIWKGNKRIPRNPGRLFKDRVEIRVGYKSLMKDTLGRRTPPINSGMFFVRRKWLMYRLVVNDGQTGRELWKELMKDEI